VRLEQRAERDVARGGADPVRRQGTDRHRQPNGAGQDEIHDPAQAERGEQRAGATGTVAEAAEQGRAGECAHGDPGEHRAVAGATGVQPALGKHHQQGTRSSRRQGRERLRDGHGSQQLVLSDQPQRLRAFPYDADPAARGSRVGRAWRREPSKQERGDDETGRVESERHREAGRDNDEAGQRSEQYLRQHGRGPDAAVGDDQLLLVDERGQQRVNRSTSSAIAVNCSTSPA